jgi:putative membrane protein
MSWIVLRWFVLTTAIAVAAYAIEGIRVSGFFSLLLAAAIVGLLNVFFRPFLIILTLPLNVLTLGLFTFVINALVLKMASGVISGLEIEGWWSAIWGALLISLVSWILNSFVGGRAEKFAYRRKTPYIELEETEDDHWEHRP